MVTLGEPTLWDKRGSLFPEQTIFLPRKKFYFQNLGGTSQLERFVFCLFTAMFGGKHRRLGSLLPQNHELLPPLEKWSHSGTRPLSQIAGAKRLCRNWTSMSSKILCSVIDRFFSLTVKFELWTMYNWFHLYQRGKYGRPEYSVRLNVVFSSQEFDKLDFYSHIGGCVCVCIGYTHFKLLSTQPCFHFDSHLSQCLCPVSSLLTVFIIHSAT